MIRRIKGRLKANVSKAVPEPNDELCDEIFLKDQFIVNDTTSVFRAEYIYICLNALEDSHFIISVSFGREKSMPPQLPSITPTNEHKEDPPIFEEIPRSVNTSHAEVSRTREEISPATTKLWFRPKRRKKTVPDKNFVEINKRV